MTNAAASDLSLLERRQRLATELKDIEDQIIKFRREQSLPDPIYRMRQRCKFLKMVNYEPLWKHLALI